MTTYPINPSERLQRRIISVLESDLLIYDAFTGFVVRNGREFTPEKYPFLSVQVTECQERPERSTVWQVTLTIAMIEDRAEANTPLAGMGTRPRHEIRNENMSARIFGVWNDLSLPDAINAIVDGAGIYVLKMHSGSQANATMSEDEIATEYSFVMLCVSTEQ
jgi:hypothetical protein